MKRHCGDSPRFRFNRQRMKLTLEKQRIGGVNYLLRRKEEEEEEEDSQASEG